MTESSVLYELPKCLLGLCLSVMRVVCQKYLRLQHELMTVRAANMYLLFPEEGKKKILVHNLCIRIYEHSCDCSTCWLKFTGSCL